MNAYLTPPNPHIPASYWLTRRSSDAAPGYAAGEGRALYRWSPARQAWARADTHDAWVGLHTNNGWRIDSEATP